ncbi:unnamed protein product [Spirodela intermedia]|uniref:Integrase catalytic domain-containing protein n=1 Tax=Spirodela intermedia TaxID=51605 RepID=A0A7I8JRE7_SPIIN|nr:unnamed protein product [Spirodela intermedia]CAA6672012.1 unnamed protein product [Spirodela intermedia]
MTSLEEEVASLKQGCAKQEQSLIEQREILNQILQKSSTRDPHSNLHPNEGPREKPTQPHNGTTHSSQASQDGQTQINQIIELPVFQRESPEGWIRWAERYFYLNPIDKGLCYYYNEKFAPGHRCKKELNIIIVDEDQKSVENYLIKPYPTRMRRVQKSAEDNTDEGWNYLIRPYPTRMRRVQKSAEDNTDEGWELFDQAISNTDEKAFTAHLSLNSVMGVSILIDSGATYNFLCTKIIDNLSLQMEKLNDYNIIMGNSNTVVGAAICKVIPLQAQGVLIVQDFLPLELSGTDVILGIQWLKTLGWIFSNYEKFIMRFMMGGKIHIFKGDPTEKELKSSKAYMVELHHIHSRRDPNAPNDLEISLKQEFPKVFEVLTGMPLERPIDHKKEIETLVQELISTKVIQPSHSPYASPTLLVKKKDNRWRFCIDYRALNRATVPDPYPILVVDELQFILIFFDDILVYNITMTEHLQNMRKYSLKFLLEQKKIHVEYHNEKINQAADALPQCPLLLQVKLNEAIAHHTIDLEDVRLVVDQDTKLVEIKTSLPKGDTTKELYSSKDGSLLYKERLLQPLPIPTQIWEDLSMDFIEGLPKSHGSNVILVVEDRLSKYSHFIVLHHPFSAKEVTQLFIKEIVRLHGFSKAVVSDRGQIFLSTFWRELTLQGTKLKFSSSYHPQTDGQTEVINSTSYHSSTKMTPFRAVYGRDPWKLIKYGTSPSSLDILEFNLHKAQVRIKFNIDKYCQEVELEVGDLVFLKIKPYWMKSLAKKETRIAYKLQLSNHLDVHTVFHISQLKKTLRIDNISQSIPSTLLEEQKWILIPNDIKSHKFKSSWMTISTFLRQFPTSHLVDKVKVMGGVMLRSQPLSTQDDLDPYVEGRPQQNNVLRPINIEEAEI